MKTLERRLGLSSVIAISMAAMLGSGLFVLPGLAAALTGPSVWLAYLVAGLCVLPAALSKAELATAMPESGGTYVYVDRTFGPLAGTIMGLGLWFSLLLKSAFALVGFGAYLKVIADVPIKPVAIGLLMFITSLNALGVRKVGKVQTWVVVISLVGLIVLAVRGAMSFDRTLLHPQLTAGLGGFWTTVSLVYISYAGVTKVAAIAEEVENPERNLPIGILASLLIVTALYGFVTLVLVGNVPVAALKDDFHPIYTLAAQIGGPITGIIAAVIGVLTMTSMANSGVLAASRFPFAMSRKNLLPPLLRYVSRRLMTPLPAILLTAALMAVSILLLDVVSIVKFASALMIVGFVIVNVAVVVLRESNIQWYKPAFRSPLYPFVQLLGVGLGLWLLLMLGLKSVIAVLAVSGAGVLTFFLFGRKHADRKGVLGRLGPRRELLAPATAQALVLPKKAAAVVPLLGRAHGAEGLAELGSILGGGEKIEVVHITDVPEQLHLEEDLDEGPLVGSLRRRVRALGDRNGHDIDFDSVATHDHIRVIYEISARVHCEWLVMEWRDRTDRGVLPFNPLGWLVDHLSCNLAVYKDVGSRMVTEILVFTEPGPHDALVAITADQLAQYHDAQLTFVRFVHDEAESKLNVERGYLSQLAKLCSTPATLRVVRGLSEVEAISSLTAEYDLLVINASPDIRLWTHIRGSRADRLMRGAACSVLRLKAPRRLLDRTTTHRDSFTEGERVELIAALSRRCVAARLPPLSKAALFTHIAGLFSEVLDVPAPRIEEALWERERAQNTALDRGLAIPHGTLSEAKHVCVGVFTIREPIDYRSPDGTPVDVIVVIVAPPSNRNAHLSILSSIARLVVNTPFLERLRAADNANELLAVLLATSHRTPPPSRNKEAAPLGESGSAS